MISAAAIAFHRKQYELQGFTILLNAVRPTFVSQMVSVIASTRDKDLIEGDESAHSWKEIVIDPPISLYDMIAGPSLATLLGNEPTRMSHWLNIYEPGEFIGAHVDAGGDAQLMIPVEMPPSGEGGDLWIECRDHVLPVAVGDVLVFAAHRLRHGTTTIRSGRRISFNGRLWLK